MAQGEERACFQIPKEGGERSTPARNGLGFPGGSVVKNLPANAGDMGLSPGLGRFHMLWSNKALALEAMPSNKRSHHYEKLAHSN